MKNIPRLNFTVPENKWAINAEFSSENNAEQSNSTLFRIERLLFVTTFTLYFLLLYFCFVIHSSARVETASMPVYMAERFSGGSVF